MHLLVAIIALILLIPAAVAGIGNGLIDALTRLECLPAALPHARAMLTELAPLAPALALLTAGVATLAVATWLIIRVVNS